MKTSPRKDKKIRTKKVKPRRPSFLVRFFRRCPAWTLWLGGGLIAAVYLFIFYYYFVSPYTLRWRALYGDAPYPEGYDVRGIDISHYQGRINWAQLRNSDIKNAPVRFIFIKATEGEDLLDENFKTNFEHARENDFITGAYHFYTPNRDPVRQARFFIKHAKLQPGDLPPVLDVESRGSLPASTFRRNVLQWLQIVENHYGVKPILYTGTRFKERYLSHPEFDGYPFWIAHYYIDKLNYKGPWLFWQHTDCGKVNGIKGHVDLNIYNGRLSDLLKLTIPAETGTTSN